MRIYSVFENEQWICDNTVTGNTPLDRKLLKEFVLITSQLKGSVRA